MTAKTTAALASDELANPSETPAAPLPQDLRGRAVFAVDTSAAGILVRTAFLTEQGQVIEMPAVFPDLGYALQQIDHLRQIVIDRFAQAAQVGVQVIAANAAVPEAVRPSAAAAEASPPDTAAHSA